MSDKEIIGGVSGLRDVIEEKCIQNLKDELSSRSSVGINVYKINEKVLREAIGETLVTN